MKLKTSFLIFSQLAFAIIITEILARNFFRDFADDKAYMDRAFSRLLNSEIRFDPSSKNYSKEFGFVLSPNSEITQTTEEFTYTSKTNSAGFRTKEIQPKAEGEYRIMLLGDSMFWGIGVDETDRVSSIMEALGKNIPTVKLSVYNFGVTGYNTTQELQVAKAYIGTVQPNHIILGFFIGNDILPNALTYIDQDGNYNTSAETEAKIKKELRESFGVLYNSTIFRMIALRTWVPKLRYEIAIRDDVIDKSYRLLRELNDLAITHHAKFSVVIFYPKDSVEGGMVGAWSNSRKPGELIDSYCQRHSIAALDLLKYMNTSEHKNKYFFVDDGHPNKAGNALVAKAIINDLVKPQIQAGR